MMAAERNLIIRFFQKHQFVTGIIPLFWQHGFNPHYPEMGWPEDQAFWDENAADIRALYIQGRRLVNRASAR